VVRQVAISAIIIALVIAGSAIMYALSPPMLAKAGETIDAFQKLPLVGALVASLSSLLSVKQILKCITFKSLLTDDYDDCVGGKLTDKDRDEKLVWWEGQLFGNTKDDNS